MLGLWRLKQSANRLRRYRLLRQAKVAVARFPTVRSAECHGLDAPLIVTLTSYPPRFPTLGATLRSLLDQTVRADRTILWVAEADEGQLPDDVRALTASGLEIRTCRDTRSYKKLIPALQTFPGAWFATADDDVYYRPDWLKGLVSSALQHGKVVVAHRAHLACLDPDGHLLPYRSWPQDTQLRRSQDNERRIFPTGVGGVLYPPGAFADAVLDEEAFTTHCPYGDDIWFFWMARMAGTNQVKTPAQFQLLSWPDSQEVSLFHENNLNDRNDLQIRNMEAAFGSVP